MTTRGNAPGRSERRSPLTRLELFLRSRRIKPVRLAREVPCSRQYLGRVRLGTTDPTRAMIARIVSAVRRISLEPVRAEDLFELTVDEQVPRGEEDARLRASAAAFTRGRTAAAELWRATAMRRPPVWLDALTKTNVTPDLVRVLIFDAERKVDSNPLRALTILETADSLAVRMKGVPPELLAALRGRTFLYRAHACRYLGRYLDALPLLDAAEEQYERAPRYSHEVAIVGYERAAILFQLEDLASAARAARRAANLFALLGDKRRTAKTQIVLGAILYESGEPEAARDTFVAIIAALNDPDDGQTLGCAYLNLGTAETQLGDVTSARRSLDKALALFTRIGLRGEMIRTRWALAKLEVLSGDRSEGLRQHRQARADFEALRMDTDAAIVALHLVEYLIEDGDRREAAAISREIIAILQRSGATTSALKAAEYLERSTRDGSSDPALVRGIRRFIERSRSGKEFDPAAVAGRT
ncbi:MAG TPA: tetratricopeptide repeat protein [Thermoanaerobaculia bacterium]|nr:tetratricopeptide repeat protein [Thermoanaerobaculia bacterium]